MFDRRVKLFLSALVLMTLVLLARALQVQVIERSAWGSEADKVLSTSELIETTRGRLLDRNGIVLAEDSPCIDACVDFRAIGQIPDKDWVDALAKSRLRTRMGEDYRRLDRARRESLVLQETEAVKADIDTMWHQLAQIGKMSMDQMDDLRQSIFIKVQMRQRSVWYKRYKKAISDNSKAEPAPAYRRWLLDLSQELPEVDESFIEVGEQTQSHVILPDIDNATNNLLAKNAEHLPGLVLRPSVHRYYPYNDLGAHVIGHLAHVSEKDISDGPSDELREYLKNDLIGRSGLEALCEPLLRGSRGLIEHRPGDSTKDKLLNDPKPGLDVHTSLDIELQNDIYQLFAKVPFKYNSDDDADKIPMPGGAVVLDIKTNEVLALVSYPSFNLNTFDDIYSSLVNDDVNRPLLNRATQFALEPGSTVKPMVGLGAITQGVFGINDTVECKGYLILNGRQYMTEGRCWVASMYANDPRVTSVEHHPIPTKDPHPTGFLTYPDALERSCNVFFETVADRLGIDGLSYWFHQFGLGKPTGIGIAESRGHVPSDGAISPALRRVFTWYSGIGQGKVLATPIQMANVAATIARRGIWERPHLLPTDDNNPADRVDLHLSPEALDLAREGMKKVVSELGGTGRIEVPDGIVLAGKTGSAQAAPLKVAQRDGDGKIIYEEPVAAAEDEDGAIVITKNKVPKREKLELGTHEKANPVAPWYRGTGPAQDHISHAWYIGFAPADDPKIAFAVMVEYGGSGGASAGGVASKILEACVKRGYLHPKPEAKEQRTE
ncbi:MAG TPA: penicillin-binding transpeptidase domain-containing protein [Tepidisphaeraceae bacterium]|nr:penicillin-binding transpeptidase domain-containing protein [Tepidisphaeraceae bacterium]